MALTWAEWANFFIRRDSSMEVSPLIRNAYTRNSNMGSKFTPDLPFTSHRVFWHDANFPIIIENR